MLRNVPKTCTGGVLKTATFEKHGKTNDYTTASKKGCIILLFRTSQPHVFFFKLFQSPIGFLPAFLAFFNLLEMRVGVPRRLVEEICPTNLFISSRVLMLPIALPYSCKLFIKLSVSLPWPESVLPFGRIYFWTKRRRRPPIFVWWTWLIYSTCYTVTSSP